MASERPGILARDISLVTRLSSRATTAGDKASGDGCASVGIAHAAAAKIAANQRLDTCIRIKVACDPSLIFPINRTGTHPYDSSARVFARMTIVRARQEYPMSSRRKYAPAVIAGSHCG